MENPNTTLKVLMIDDDRDEFLLIRDLLSEKTIATNQVSRIVISLEWVGTYEGGMQALDYGNHDVFLVDYHLGARDGLELLREARQRGLRSPIILLTGRGSYEVDLEAMRSGATDYLVKGEVTGPLLERTIRYALERTSTEEALRRAQDELEFRVQERTQALGRAIENLRAENAERKRAQAALDQERNRLFNLLEELPAYVYLQAPDCTVRFANGKFCEQFGSPSGKFCYQVLHRREEPCPVCPPKEIFQNQVPAEWEWTSQDGTSFQVFGYPFTDTDSSPLVLELGIDITHRKQIEAQLVRSEKFAAMGRMVASIAHELNNPLQTIKNCLFLSQQEIPAGSVYQDYLNMAYSETQRLSNLVTQLRELYRPRDRAPMELIHLDSVVAEVQLLLSAQFEASNVFWQQKIDDQPALFLVKGSPEQLKQVLINLCTNALEAMQPDGGVLNVKLVFSERRDLVGVSLADNGPGIAPENLSRIFEPFYTTKAHGAGLGLAICFEIIERHSGRIEVASQPGKGTTFTVWLPAEPSLAVAPGKGS